MEFNTEKTAVDLSENLEIVKEDKSKYYSTFLTAYRSRINEFYQEEYKAQPKYFKLMGPVKVIIVVLYTTVYEFLIASESDMSSCEYYNANMSVDEWRKFSKMPSDAKLQKALSYIPEAVNNKILFEHHVDYSSYGYSYSDSLSSYNANNQGCAEADSSLNALKLVNIFETLNTHTNEFKLYPPEDVIHRVNDKQFSYEFNECIKCYEHGLFLASAMTGIVCIETLLMLLQESKLENVTSETYILKQIGHLKKNKVIDTRFQKRLEAINSLRHASAHSASGEMKQWDTDNVLYAIDLLVKAYF